MSLPHIDIKKPGELINAGAGSGLGWGLGTALGAKLAVRDRLVIAAEGDGSYLFGNPLSAHYVAAEQDLPFLTVIFNNGRWNAVENSTLGLNPDGYAAKSKRPPLTFLDAVTDYEKVAEFTGGYGEKVTDPTEMMPALERALKAVTVEKRQAILNVISSSIPR
ncbi:MAG: thiamine pyrophosphate-dependent enzyme [Pseudomonadota bacterium]